MWPGGVVWCVGLAYRVAWPEWWPYRREGMASGVDLICGCASQIEGGKCEGLV